MQLVVSVAATTWLTLSLAELGEFDEAHRVAAEGERIAQAVNQAYTVFHACMASGVVNTMHGRIAEAISHLDRGVAVAAAAGLPRLEYAGQGHLGHAYVLAGWMREGKERLESLLGAAVVLTEGLTGAAERAAAEAVNIAEATFQRGVGTHALRVLAAVAAQRAGIAESEERYRRAMAIAAELDMRPLVAHCHAGLATLYRRTGQEDRAHDHFATAATMYCDMGMMFWLEKLQREFND